MTRILASQRVRRWLSDTLADSERGDFGRCAYLLTEALPNDLRRQSWRQSVKLSVINWPIALCFAWLEMSIALLGALQLALPSRRFRAMPK